MRQEKFLGISVNVVSDEEVVQEAERDGDTIRSYIVMRVQDDIPELVPPTLAARRLRTLCEKCGELCYIDPLCMETFRPLPLEIVCMPCFLETTSGPLQTSSSLAAWADAPVFRTPR